MKFVCDNCARPAVGATTYHVRDGLVRVECDKCHARRTAPSIPLRIRCVAAALWLVLLGTQTPWIVSRLSPR